MSETLSAALQRVTSRLAAEIAEAEQELEAAHRRRRDLQARIALARQAELRPEPERRVTASTTGALPEPIVDLTASAEPVVEIPAVIAKPAAAAAPTLPVARLTSSEPASAEPAATPVDLPPLPRSWLHALAALRSGDPAVIRTVLSPNIVLRWEGSNRFSGTFLGAEVVAAFAQELFRSLDSSTVRLERVETIDEGLSFDARATIRGLLEEDRLSALITGVMTFDGDGRIARFAAMPQGSDEVDAFLDAGASNGQPS